MVLVGESQEWTLEMGRGKESYESEWSMAERKEEPRVGEWCDRRVVRRGKYGTGDGGDQRDRPAVAVWQCSSADCHLRLEFVVGIGTFGVWFAFAYSTYDSSTAPAFS